MMSIEWAARVAEVLGGRVWTANSADLRRVYWGSGKGESYLFAKEDGSIVVQTGRGVSECDVLRSLVSAGLALGTERETSYGSTIDNVVAVGA